MFTAGLRTGDRKPSVSHVMHTAKKPHPGCIRPKTTSRMHTSKKHTQDAYMSTEQVSLVTNKYLLSYISTNFSLLIKLLRIMIPLLLALLLQYFGLDPDRQRNPHIHIYLVVGQTIKFLPNCVSERLTSLSRILKERKKS